MFKKIYINPKIPNPPTFPRTIFLCHIKWGSIVAFNCYFRGVRRDSGAYSEAIRPPEMQKGYKCWHLNLLDRSQSSFYMDWIAIIKLHCFQIKNIKNLIKNKLVVLQYFKFMCVFIWFESLSHTPFLSISLSLEEEGGGGGVGGSAFSINTA